MPTAPSCPQVNYPKFGGPKYNVDPGAARLRAIPRRKQADVILKELREEEERLRALPPPRPRGELQAVCMHRETGNVGDRCRRGSWG